MMPYVPSFERFMKADAYLDGIEAVLIVRFGQDAEALMPQIREIADDRKLLALLRNLVITTTLEEVRQRIEFYKSLPPLW